MNTDKQKQYELIYDTLLSLGMYDFKILNDLTVNVLHDVNLKKRGLTRLPLHFNKIEGYFDCSENNLISLEGSPKEVAGFFDCSSNQLTSLIGAPKKTLSIKCQDNALTSLEGVPQNMQFCLCSNNQINTLKGLPSDFKGALYINNNQLTNLKYLPENLEVLEANSNKIISLEHVPLTLQSLSIHDNPLSDINYLPKNVNYLYLTHTNIEILDLLQNNDLTIHDHIVCDMQESLLCAEPELLQFKNGNKLYIDGVTWAKISLKYKLENNLKTTIKTRKNKI